MNMTNVSKNKLDDTTQQKLFTQFSALFVQSDQKHISKLFQALFTDSEKIMFMKRLAVILMVAEGHSTYAVAGALHVSDRTARNIKVKLHAGVYDDLIKVTNHKSFDNKKFWDSVEVLLRLGMPSYSGKDRWKTLDKYLPKNNYRS